MMLAPHLTATSTARLRDELQRLRARYDSGTISPAIFAVIRELETSIAWIEHSREARP
jgi:hypothetical protein